MCFAEARLLDLSGHPTADSIVWKAQWIIKTAELVLCCSLLNHVWKITCVYSGKEKGENESTHFWVSCLNVLGKKLRYLFCPRLSREFSLFSTYEKTI